MCVHLVFKRDRYSVKYVIVNLLSEVFYETVIFYFRPFF